jgi:hypothetical protein
MLLADPGLRALFVIPAVLILCDLLSGIASAVRHRGLLPDYLPKFMSKQVLPFGVTLTFLLVGGLGIGQSLTAIAIAGHAVLVPFYLAQLDSISANLGEIFTKGDSWSVKGVVELALDRLFPELKSEVATDLAKESAGEPPAAPAVPTPATAAPALVVTEPVSAPAA